jgi:hypothetical protein
MGTKTHFYKVVVCLYFLGLSPALADEALASLHFIGRYDFNWSGVALGALTLAIDEDGDVYKMRLVVKSEGIVNLFTHHVDDTIAGGERNGSAYLPQYYETYYKTKKKPRHVKLAFDDKGAVVEELNVPPEDRSDRPEVPHSLKDGAYDPLSLLMVVRGGARDIKGFDAKRLYAVKVQEKGRDTLYVEGKWRKVTIFSLSRTPLGGLTAKEMKEYKKGEPPLTVYFSNDAQRIPLAVEVPIMFGEVTGVLVKECKAWAECGLEVDAK